MPVPRFQSITRQVAEYLREELSRGRWTGEMPGQHRLVRLLGVSRKTVEMALQLLQEEGLLVGQGVGRRCRIVLPEDGLGTPALRVALLVLDAPSQGEDYMIDLRHRLEVAGHLPFFAAKTLRDLGMDARRVARFVGRTEVDAWVVHAGSREVLEWFAEQETPVFAWFGRREGLPIAGAGPDKAPVFAEVTRRLIALGHRRISCLCRRMMRLPEPARGPLAFLDELEAAGIDTGAFNLPDWEESSKGFERILDSLFGRTTPTALILDERFLYHAAHHYLARHGLRVPADVSLVCTDADPSFGWCLPPVTHTRWGYRPMVRRILRWSNHVASGKVNRRQSFTKAELVKGETIGPAPA